MNKKGFTLIELLAILVILPILMMIAYPSIQKYLNKSEKQYYIDVEKNLESTAMDLVVDHNEFLPKVLGSYKKITVQQMLNYKEIDKVTSKDGKDCASGYVVIQKRGVNDYQYTACLVCGKYRTSSSVCSLSIS